MSRYLRNTKQYIFITSLLAVIALISFSSISHAAVAANGLTISSPASGANVSGVITIKGEVDSSFKNLAAFDAANGYKKLSSDVSPANGSYSLSVDTKQLAKGSARISIIAFTVAAGQPGGTNTEVILNVTVNNSVPTPTPAPTATPSPTGWTFCANENATCTFSGTKQVRYGSNGKYATKTATNWIACNNATFGDPNPGVLKTCDYANATSATPTPTPKPTPSPTPVPTATPNPMALSITSPASGSTVSGTITVKGAAGSAFKNISAFDIANNYNKVGNDVTPSNGGYSISVDTKKLANGNARIAVIAFTVAAGQSGGSSMALELNVKVNNSVVTPTPTPTPVPTPTPTPPPTGSVPAPIAGMNYKLTFSDNFTSLNTISVGNTYNGAKWYNGIVQCCMTTTTGENTAMFPTVINGVQVNPYSLIPGGGLNIALVHQGNTWFSGILASVDKNMNGFSQKYGYFEMTAKLPAGDGVWPAFWLLSADRNSPGEIDIMEYYGHDAGTTFGITLHDWRSSGAEQMPPSYFPRVSGLTSDYHTYAMLWTESTMKFYLDGKLLYETRTPAMMKVPYYVLVNNGMGAGWPTNNTPNNALMQVKSIRVFAP